MNATTVEELKGLYVKMGGSIEDVVDIQTDAEMIEKIKEVAIPAELPSVTSEDNGDVLTVVEGEWAKAEAGSSLPDVTAEDNGDVLTVVEGAWSKATPSGGENIINFTGTNFNGTNVSFTNLTFEENISEIFNSIDTDNFSKTILKGTDTANNTILFLPSKLNTNSSAWFHHVIVGNVAGSMCAIVHMITISKSNETKTTNSEVYVLKNN